VHTLILDNGPQYTATASVLYAHELGLVPITTPSYEKRTAAVGLSAFSRWKFVRYLPFSIGKSAPLLHNGVGHFGDGLPARLMPFLRVDMLQSRSASP
jgi:hypothetical protein